VTTSRVKSVWPLPDETAMMIPLGGDVPEGLVSDPDAGHIPVDVLEGMACSVDFWLRAGSDEKRAFARTLHSYECAIGGSSEAMWRARLCELYLACIPAACGRFVTPEQRRALEACAAGEGYKEPPAMSPEGPGFGGPGGGAGASVLRRS
jgi:hypothetical protein